MEKKEFYLNVKGQKVMVTEEVYRTYVRPVRAEQKREERNKRCLIEKIVKGKKRLVRCKGDCSICEKEKQYPQVCSFDLLQEEGFEIADDLNNVEEQIIEEENKREIALIVNSALDCLEKNQKNIAKLFYLENLSQTEVANRLKLSKSFVSKSIKKLEPILREILLKKLRKKENLETF